MFQVIEHWSGNVNLEGNYDDSGSALLAAAQRFAFMVQSDLDTHNAIDPICFLTVHEDDPLKPKWTVGQFVGEIVETV